MTVTENNDLARCTIETLLGFAGADADMDQGRALAVPAIVNVEDNTLSASTKSNFHAGQVQVTENHLKQAASVRVGAINCASDMVGDGPGDGQSRTCAGAGCQVLFIRDIKWRRQIVRCAFSHAAFWLVDEAADLMVKADLERLENAA